jgi:putative oxidoreductase
MLDGLTARLGVEPRVARWMARHDVDALRISLGLVFLGFGVLKFFPGLSPAEDLVEQTVAELSFGRIPDRPALVLVAALETTIGLCLMTGWFLRIGLVLLGLAMLGILAPLVLLPEELFRGRAYAPTLAGQYVLKDVVLLAAGPVVADRTHGVKRLNRRPGHAAVRHSTRKTAGRSRPVATSSQVNLSQPSGPAS